MRNQESKPCVLKAAALFPLALCAVAAMTGCGSDGGGGISDTEMVFVEGGTFTMGCPPGWEDNCDDDEKPSHSVTLSNFYIGKYEVTQRLWKEVMGGAASYKNPPQFWGDKLPVDNVSWDEARRFIAELNRQTGKKYRLPTEAEWEYAARGGNKSEGYAYSGGDVIDEIAWYDGNSGSIRGRGKTRAVGTKQPNELGIHDMTGNVSEWVSDWHGRYAPNAKMNPAGPRSGTNRVYRGGSWNFDAEHYNVYRVHDRASSNPNRNSGSIGFRLALDASEDSAPASCTLAINVTPAGGGAVFRDLDLEAYPAGTRITLTAKAAPGYRFAGWTAVASGKESAVPAENKNAAWTGTENFLSDGNGDSVRTEKGKTFRVAMAGNVRVAAAFEAVDIEKYFAVPMVSVQGGTFTMGCTPEQNCSRDEGTYYDNGYMYYTPKYVDSVTVSNFRISKYPVTRELWAAVMGNISSISEENSDMPATAVSWDEAQAFIAELNRQTGKRYRLPTEAEWEYAARGGNKSRGYKYSGSDNVDDVAWYGGNSGDRMRRYSGSGMQKVGTKQPNELGIHDMSGNVSEWASDWYGPYTAGAKTDPAGPPEKFKSYGRALRGGDWNSDSERCRVSSRANADPDYSSNDIGFRLVLSP
jgi:formylglycine-generating enzyme required for sulfatase activity